MLQPRLGVRALFLSEDSDRLAAKACEAADDRIVLAEGAVAGQRREIGEQPGDVVDAMRAIRVAGDLRLLPRRQLPVKVAQRFA